MSKSRRTMFVKFTCISLLSALLVIPGIQAADNAVKLNLWEPWGGPSNPPTSFDSQYSDFLAKKIGVRIALNPCQSDAGQAINLFRAGKNFPDVLFGAWLSGALQWRDEGNIIALNKYFHNPNYPNLAKISDSVLDFFKNDKGEIVAIPSGPPVVADLTKPLSTATVDATQRAYGWFARKDLVKEFGKPLNTEAAVNQFAAFCKTKKALDGTGVEPFGVARWATYPAFDYFFLWNFGGRNGFMADGKGKPAVMENTKPYYEMMKHLNKWFQTGMISPEVFTDSYDVYSQKLASARYGMTWCSSWAILGFNERMQNPDRAYVPITHWKAPGVRNFMANSDPMANPTQMGWTMEVVSSDCKNPDAAMKLIDYLSGDEGYISGKAGAPGEGWNWVDRNKGIYTLTELGKKISYEGGNKDWITEAGKYGVFMAYQFSAYDSSSIKVDKQVDDPMYALCLNTWKGYVGTLYGHVSATIDMAPASEAEQTANNEWQPKKAQWLLNLMQAKNLAAFDTIYKKGLQDNASALKAMESEREKSWKAFLAKHSLKDDPKWYGPVVRIVNW